MLLSLSDEPLTAAVRVHAWRDYAPEAQSLPGMALGPADLAGDLRRAVADLYADGARYVRFTEPVTVCGQIPAASARALVALRELTARGVAAYWIARCESGCASHEALSHLFPPVLVFGADGRAAATWRARFFAGRCVSRRGPGFVEVRDRRFGPFVRHTFADGATMAVIEASAGGVAAALVPDEIHRCLTDAHLVAESAGRLFWLPTPIYSWPFPAMVV